MHAAVVCKLMMRHHLFTASWAEYLAPSTHFHVDCELIWPQVNLLASLVQAGHPAIAVMLLMVDNALESNFMARVMPALDHEPIQPVLQHTVNGLGVFLDGPSALWALTVAISPPVRNAGLAEDVIALATNSHRMKRELAAN